MLDVFLRSAAYHQIIIIVGIVEIQPTQDLVNETLKGLSFTLKSKGHFDKLEQTK